jgi:hypothetical protein
MNRTRIVLLLGWSAVLLGMGLWGSALFPASDKAGSQGGNGFGPGGMTYTPCQDQAPAAPAPAPAKTVCTLPAKKSSKACKALEKPEPVKSSPTRPCAQADTLVFGHS